MSNVKRDAKESQSNTLGIQRRNGSLYRFQDVLHEKSNMPRRSEAGLGELYLNLVVHLHMHARIRASDAVDQPCEFCAIFRPINGLEGGLEQFKVAEPDMQIVGRVFLVGRDKDSAELHNPMLVEPVDFMKKPERIVRSAIWLHALDECPLVLREVTNSVTFELGPVINDGEICPTRIDPLRSPAKIVDRSIKCRPQMVGDFVDPDCPTRGWRPLDLGLAQHDLIERWIVRTTVSLGLDFIGLALDESMGITLESLQLCACRAKFEVNAGRGFHGVYSHHEQGRSAQTEDPKGSGNHHPQAGGLHARPQEGREDLNSEESPEEVASQTERGHRPTLCQ